MTTINFVLEQVTNHTVTIEIPAYFKVVHPGVATRYYQILDEKHMDQITKFADGSCDTLSGSAFNPKVLDFDLSSESEFIDIMIEARDYLDNKIDLLSGYTKETEEDEEPSEEEIAEMHGDDIVDGRIKSEQENFHELTKQGC